MPGINYTADQVQQINDLQAYIQEWCDTHGVDPSIYTEALDGSAAISPAMLNDPVFQAYWQLAYLRLMEIINPTLVQSLYAETGEVDFDALYAAADPETNAFIENLVVDSPELMAFAVMSDGDPDTVAANIFVLLEENESADPFAEFAWTDEEAREIGEELGLGGMWDWMVGTEEGIRSTENWLFNYLSEIDQQLADMQEALASGELTAEGFSANVESVSVTRQVVVGMIQNLEEAWNNLLELYSNMVKSEHETQMGILSRSGSSAA